MQNWSAVLFWVPLHPKPKGRNHHYHSLPFMSMKSSSSEIEMSPLESNPCCCCLWCTVPQFCKKCVTYSRLCHSMAWHGLCFPSPWSAPSFSAMQGKILIIMRYKSESQAYISFDCVTENFPGTIRLRLSLHKFWERGSAMNGLKHELRHK